MLSPVVSVIMVIIIMLNDCAVCSYAKRTMMNTVFALSVIMLSVFCWVFYAEYHSAD
jgi:hypothetical protein